MEAPVFQVFTLNPFEELGGNRQLIPYNQLGSGKSDVITDTDGCSERCVSIAD